MKLTPTVDAQVVALCADFRRRQEAIREQSVSHRTEMEYRYLNIKLTDAATEIAGERTARDYILEIGGRKGYACSELYYVSEATYKQQKQQIKLNIAKRLHLVD